MIIRSEELGHTSIVLKNAGIVGGICARLVECVSCWFEIEPWPDDEWKITVKNDALPRLEEIIKDVLSKDRPELVAAARNYYTHAPNSTDDIEIDDWARVSGDPENGYWVQAWLWLNPNSAQTRRP